jgi:hypothetical protein
VLISADPGRPNGGGVFHDTAVWVKPLFAAKAGGRAAKRIDGADARAAAG